MELNYREMGSGPPLIILHGLFGTLDNWATIGRRLSDEFLVWLVDLRNHGRSPHAAQHDYPAMAEDLRAFMENHWMFDGAAVMGHSMGGKVAMQLALTYPELVQKLIVVDIAPRRYQDHHSHIIQALLELHPETLPDREAAEAKLAQTIADPAVRQFLLKNLTRRKEGGYEFKMNLQALHKHYDDILAPVHGKRPYEGPTLFIKGELSPYIQPEDEQSIRQLFPRAEIRTVKGAGHWVHADQPDALLDLVRHFLLAEEHTAGAQKP
ncbi:MAG: alpha/beta hydrolase [Saprospiraceae bacterium]|nr:MAG: alpha/beta hydrolase [Saprospiraceae bacterium]